MALSDVSSWLNSSYASLARTTKWYCILLTGYISSDYSGKVIVWLSTTYLRPYKYPVFIKLINPDPRFLHIDDSCPINLYYDYYDDFLISPLIPHLLISILLYEKVHSFFFSFSLSLAWTNDFLCCQCFIAVLSYFNAQIAPNLISGASSN